ncbi:hypothetical protein DFH09DRAFT_1339545 [Mycena vulgaris]|nr:hypothetical protein DFH09DRAFT_1339545 [Mycena vulgaris]
MHLVGVFSPIYALLLRSTVLRHDPCAWNVGATPPAASSTPRSTALHLSLVASILPTAQSVFLLPRHSPRILLSCAPCRAILAPEPVARPCPEGRPGAHLTLGVTAFAPRQCNAKQRLPVSLTRALPHPLSPDPAPSARPPQSTPHMHARTRPLPESPRNDASLIRTREIG